MPRRKEPEIGPELPLLDFEEAARVLGTSRVEFMEWIDRVVKPSDDLLSKWVRGARPLPEKLVRLYLATKGAAATRRAVALSSGDPLAPIRAQVDETESQWASMDPAERREKVAHIVNQIGLLAKERRDVAGAPVPAKSRRRG